MYSLVFNIQLNTLITTLQPKQHISNIKPSFKMYISSHNNIQVCTLFNSLYELSETGIITSLHKRNHGQTINKRIDRAGYYTVRLSNNGKTKTFFLHRLLAESFVPNPLNKPFVNHINGDKLDYTLSNLEWSTGSENMQHAFLKGLCKAPEFNSKPVTDIFTGKLYQSIWMAAKHTGLPYSTCKNFLNGRRKNRTSLRYQK